MTDATVDNNWSLLDQPFKHTLSLRCKNVDGIAALSLCVKIERGQSWAKVLRLYLWPRTSEFDFKVHPKTQRDTHLLHQGKQSLMWFMGVSISINLSFLAWNVLWCRHVLTLTFLFLIKTKSTASAFSTDLVFLFVSMYFTKLSHTFLSNFIPRWMGGLCICVHHCQPLLSSLWLCWSLSPVETPSHIPSPCFPA